MQAYITCRSLPYNKTRTALMSKTSFSLFVSICYRQMIIAYFDTHLLFGCSICLMKAILGDSVTFLVLFNIINLLINDSALDSEGYLFCGFQLQVNLPLLYNGSIGFYVLINHITITPFREGFTFTLMVIPIEIASFLKEKNSSWNMDHCDQNRVNQKWYDELVLEWPTICQRRNGIHFAKYEIWQI